MKEVNIITVNIINMLHDGKANGKGIEKKCGRGQFKVKESAHAPPQL